MPNREIRKPTPYETNAIFEIIRAKNYFVALSIIVILVSAVIWYALIATTGYNKVLALYGEPSAKMYSQIVSLPAEFVIFAVFLVILANLTFKSLFRVTTLAALGYLFLYVISPTTLFRWVDPKLESASK